MKKGSIISVGAIIDHDVCVEEFVHVNAGSYMQGWKCNPRTGKTGSRVRLEYKDIFKDKE